MPRRSRDATRPHARERVAPNAGRSSSANVLEASLVGGCAVPPCELHFLRDGPAPAFAKGQPMSAQRTVERSCARGAQALDDRRPHTRFCCGACRAAATRASSVLESHVATAQTPSSEASEHAQRNEGRR